MPPHIAVLGANGRLANEVLHAFHAAGFQVSAISRDGRVRRAPVGIKTQAADAMNLPQLKKAVRGANFIFNGLNPKYTDWTQAALPLARNVMEAARSTRAVHLFPGNLYNYGPSIPPFCNAETAWAAKSGKGRIRIEMERLFKAAADKYAIKTVVVRAGDFYGGSGVGSWFDLALVDKLDKDQFVYPGPMEVIHSWAYLPDLAQTFLALAQHSQDLPQYADYLFPGHALTGSAFKQYTEQATGQTLKTLPFPWKVLRMGRWFVPMWRELVEVAYLWERPHQLDGSALRQVLGEIPHTEPEQAIHTALAMLGKVKGSF